MRNGRWGCVCVCVCAWLSFNSHYGLFPSPPFLCPLCHITFMKTSSPPVNIKHPTIRGSYVSNWLQDDRVKINPLFNPNSLSAVMKSRVYTGIQCMPSIFLFTFKYNFYNKQWALFASWHNTILLDIYFHNLIK